MLDDSHHVGNWLWTDPWQLLPDGIGGLLIVADHATSGISRQRRVTHLDSEGARSDTPLDSGTRIELIGEAGTSYVHRMINNGSSPWTSLAKDVVDVGTWQTMWTLPLNWSWTAAAPAKGALVKNAFQQLASFDDAGQMTALLGITSADPIQRGDSWLIGAGGLSAYAADFFDVTLWNATLQVENAGANQQVPKRLGNAANQNAPRVPTLVHFVVPPELAIPGTGDPYLPSQYKTDVTGDFLAGRLQGLPRFFNVEDATADRFLKEIAGGNDAVAFIGHSVLIPEKPEWGSVGLTFTGKSIVKRMSPEQPFGPGGLAYTQIVDTIASKARVIFIGACETSAIFQSLWDVDSTTANRSLIVPIGADARLVLGCPSVEDNRHSSG